jgi:FkbM family methyltransferase
MARAFPGSGPGLLDEAAAIARRGRRRLRERRCRAAVDVRRAEGRSDLRMVDGARLFVDPADQGLSRSLMADGFWEMWLTEALEAAVRPGMVAIDIGANVGYFTMLMGGLVGPGGHVHAFEPNPPIADLLAASVTGAGLDARVTLHRDALWDVDGAESLLKVPVGEPKNAHLVTGAGDGVAGTRLLSRRLDGYPELLDADVVKIDVEGAEERVWRGMAGLFARARPLTVFLEFTPFRYDDPMAFLHAITTQGFTLGELSISHGVRRVSAADILAGRPDEDRMLALTRGQKRGERR